MYKLISLFRLYRPQGFIQASIVLLRILILPFWKIDKVLPDTGTIIDIGCGNGGMSNYLSISCPKRQLVGIDIAEKRIQQAVKTVGKREDIKFKLGNILDIKLNTTNHYLMVDVLHHIPYNQQNELLFFLSKIIKKNSLLVIKDTDKTNSLFSLFGDFTEKILYPHDQIYTRSKKEWTKRLTKLGFNCHISRSSPFFPDSSFIVVCSKNIE